MATYIFFFRFFDNPDSELYTGFLNCNDENVQFKQGQSAQRVSEYNDHETDLLGYT